MSIYEKIVAAYPELADTANLGVMDPFANGTIHIRKDDDQYGEYLAKWEYSKPLPEGLKLGKG